jgi:predicted flap endonuclease-1-like 5' DNA nuclease
MKSESTANSLPHAIGNPATTALEMRGVTELSQLAAWTEKELSELHGVGPKAVSILRGALKEQGLQFRAD